MKKMTNDQWGMTNEEVRAFGAAPLVIGHWSLVISL
jgi:hypothetical protein